MKIGFFKKEKHFKKPNFVFHTNLYWKVAMCIVFGLSIISCIFGYSLFIKVNQEFTAQNTMQDSTQMQKTKKAKIDTVLQYFSDREQKSNDILSSPSYVV